VINLTTVRNQIPLTERVAYFNTGWSGPSPRPVIDAINERLEFENSEGPTASHVLESRRQISADVRQAVADFIHVSPEEITLTQNTTHGLNIVLSGISWQSGDEIVTCNLEHSSVFIPLHYLKLRYGVEIKVAVIDPEDDNAAILVKLEAKMSPKTRLLALSHISYSAGTRLPITEIQELAHRYGALVLWDAAQSAGHIELDLRAANCDFYALPGHKWLLGPDGVGALFIRNDLIPQVMPAHVAYWGAKSYDIEGNVEPNPEAIEKFELTTSSAPLLAGFRAAIDFIQEAGMSNVEARIKALSVRLRDQLSNVSGVSVATSESLETVTGLVGVAVDGLEAEDVVTHLWEYERVVARTLNWPPSTRISVEFFNTEEEIDKLVATFERLAREGIPERVRVERDAT
jgi:L-cysteine/cystine lyase